jgi:hypothetical protein
MSVDKEIIKLVKAEGYKINEAIRDALDEFVDIVNEENETMTGGDDLNKEEEPEEPA